MNGTNVISAPLFSTPSGSVSDPERYGIYGTVNPPSQSCTLTSTGTTVHAITGVEDSNGQPVPALSWSALTSSDPSLGVNVTGTGSVCDALSSNGHAADLPIPQGGVSTEGCPMGQLTTSSGSESSFKNALLGSETVGSTNLPLNLSYGGTLGCTLPNGSESVADHTTISLTSSPCSTPPDQGTDDAWLNPEPRPSDPVLEMSEVTQNTCLSYVALGDSYSSGEGNPPFTGGKCHRSAQSYPKYFQDYFSIWRGGFYFEACSGATLSQVLDQADMVPEAATDTVRLVTLTIGGNDLHFSDVIEECVYEHVVRRSTCTDPDGFPPHKLADLQMGKHWPEHAKQESSWRLAYLVRYLPERRHPPTRLPSHLPEHICFPRRAGRVDERLRAPCCPRPTEYSHSLCGTGCPLAQL